ncbi:asparagine synthase (glutamine-hydrolyzing) [Thalassotalea psychrophila]|uniref:asparagine synthase (glutamine-hydrolyzing) n=1 Tax=Thalassotalea psychrophila TaxID=3065647 RepID=A0ABY9TVP2_9GAMM|nr:asparagine synthase (glutamine-hydrolyzing) [Colwelliaceae bacterium SQ149]
MCGIAGFTCLTNIIADKSTLKEMGQSMIHRGPDAGDIYLDDCIGLCHRRLSIIDISSAGIQPMQSQCGKYIIVFNGEIYNFQQLRKELIKTGSKFVSLTDTEVLLALYQRYGEKLLDKINGMFAFAIWDKKKESLFIARDRLGKKPLYYSLFKQELIFASELKALLKIKQLPKQIRTDAVYDFFAYQYIPDPKTIYKDIFKLEPGHYLTFDKNGLHKKKYWDISFANTQDIALDQAKNSLSDLLNESTKQRMIADVPLGAFLSGGIDSSAVVSLMAQNSAEPVITCSIGFNDKQLNETEFAKAVAEQYQTHHFELTVDENVADNLEHIVSFFDEPFADPSLIPTYFVAKLAREKVTVAISGDGGDEVFAGYEKYSIDAIENNLRVKTPKFIRKNILPFSAKLFSKFNNKYCQKASSLLHSLSLDPDAAFYISNSHISNKEWDSLATGETKRAIGNYHPSSITTNFYQKCDSEDHLAKILYTDIKTYLPGDILVKVDRMSMANSLEVRAPLLDYGIAQFAASLPSHLKFNKGIKKYILKEAFKDTLPNDILNRKKMGFTPPVASWLRNELKDIAEIKLLNNEFGLVNFFKIEKINQFWQEHQQHKRDHSTLLWSMLMFQMWWDKYMVTQ